MSPIALAEATHAKTQATLRVREDFSRHGLLERVFDRDVTAGKHDGKREEIGAPNENARMTFVTTPTEAVTRR
jgi:hypothetical protein